MTILGIALSLVLAGASAAGAPGPSPTSAPPTTTAAAVPSDMRAESQAHWQGLLRPDGVHVALLYYQLMGIPPAENELLRFYDVNIPDSGDSFARQDAIEAVRALINDEGSKLKGKRTFITPALAVLDWDHYDMKRQGWPDPVRAGSMSWLCSTKHNRTTGGWTVTFRNYRQIQWIPVPQELARKLHEVKAPATYDLEWEPLSASGKTRRIHNDHGTYTDHEIVARIVRVRVHPLLNDEIFAEFAVQDEPVGAAPRAGGRHLVTRTVAIEPAPTTSGEVAEDAKPK